MKRELSVENTTENAVQRLGEKASKLEFDALLAYATHVCLTAPPDYDNIKVETDEPEKPIVSLLGLRGLRAAIELSEGYTIMPPAHLLEAGEEEAKSEETSDNPDTFLMRLDSPIVYPDTWSDEINDEIVAKATLFGEALLDEAYTVLGKDADQKIDQLRTAADAQEQAKVIYWLDQRLKALTSIDTPASDDAPYRHFYHPIRLSPKATGVYPSHNVAPTCLSVSIIANSFLKKAGLDTLHAGVNESAADKNVGSGILLTQKILQEYPETYGAPFSNPSHAALKNLFGHFAKTHTRQEAQHAAVYARLKDNSWAQVDPNFHATFIIEELEENAQLTKAYSTLYEYEPVAPGLELSVLLPGNATMAEIVERVLDRQNPELLFSIKENARDAILTCDAESVPQTIYERCIEPFYATAENNPLLKAFQLILDGNSINHTTVGFVEPIVQEAFYTTFEKYVLWGDSMETFLERARTDEQYLNNRAEDISMLPFMIAASIAKSEVERGSPAHTHPKLDVGIPETRIGMAVLSDFATYDDSSLPASFWTTYWPGNAAVADHLYDETYSKPSRNILQANVTYYLMHPFTSNKNYDIIKSFLTDEREEA